jgi:hypothetical protein
LKCKFFSIWQWRFQESLELTLTYDRDF